MRREGLPLKKEAGPARAIQRSNHYLFEESGFTLLELAIAIAIFVIGACGVVSLFISTAALGDASGYVTFMANRARQELEDTIQRIDFDNLADNSQVISLTPPVGTPDATIVRYVQNHNSAFCPDQNNLKELRIVISYREKGDRIMGEDQNLNGSLDAGEDINGDGRLTSPCEAVTFVARDN